MASGHFPSSTSPHLLLLSLRLHQRHSASFCYPVSSSNPEHLFERSLSPNLLMYHQRTSRETVLSQERKVWRIAPRSLEMRGLVDVVVRLSLGFGCAARGFWRVLNRTEEQVELAEPLCMTGDANGERIL